MLNMSWTDELKQEVIEAYEKAEPTSANSTEIVKELAERFEKTPNGVRMILTKADVYIAKGSGTAASAKASSDGGDKPKRVNKADAINSLAAAIEDAGSEVDREILDKLTGKAAMYFTSVMISMQASD